MFFTIVNRTRQYLEYVILLHFFESYTLGCSNLLGGYSRTLQYVLTHRYRSILDLYFSKKMFMLSA